MDGQAITSTLEFSTYINARADQPVDLRISRDGVESDIVITPKPSVVEGKTVGLLGIRMARLMEEGIRERLLFTSRSSVGDALYKGAVETWDLSVMTLRVMGRLITGEASIKNISGPITIANYAGKSALIGFSVFMSFLAIVSLSLGVLNLLPVPMLDGGHLLYYLIEIVKGSPVSEKVEEIGMRIGMAMVGVLMVLAIYNDITRLVS
jgi:regulator of sigma E protease